jgi:hypothetical protein
MSNPLFKTEASVLGARRRVYQEPDEDDEDEDWVDRSLPSSPLDRTLAQGPFDAGPSEPRPRNDTPPIVADNNGENDLGEDMKSQVGSDEGYSDAGEGSLDHADEQEREPEDERQCRICFSGREEEPALGRLISPCLCTGSVRVSIHLVLNVTELTPQYVHGMSAMRASLISY